MVASAAHEDLSQRLRTLRSRRDLSQQELAHILGATPQSVSRWENGDEPQPRWRRAIEDLFDQDAGEAPVLTLVSADQASRSEPLTELQHEAVQAFLRRVGGGQLTAQEAALFRAVFARVGIDDFDGPG